MSCSKPSPYFFLPVIVVQVDLNFSHPKNVFPEVVWLFLDIFLQSQIWPCLHLVVNPLYLLWWTLDCRLWQRHIYLLCSSLGWMLWKSFSLPWRWFADQPPLLSSVDVQAFLCCWAHQCVLFLSECTKLLIWPLLMFLLSLWWIFIIILKPNNCLFHLHGEILWPHLSMKQLLSQLSNYLWFLEKGGRYILKSWRSLTFPPIVKRIPSI